MTLFRTIKNPIKTLFSNGASNLIPSIIVALIVVGFIIGIGYTIGTSGTATGPNIMTAGSLNKGLVGHWKLNNESEKVGSELVTNGDFSDWTTDNPDDWSVTGESGTDPEISEVGNGEGHGGTGTGACNIYSTGTLFYMDQSITVVIGKTYRLSLIVDTVISGAISVQEAQSTDFAEHIYSTTGVKSFEFIPTTTTVIIRIKRSTASDVTIDNVSIKELQTADSTPNANHGTVYGATSTTDRKGQSEGAMSFVGADGDYIDTTNVGTISNTFSVSLWVKPNNYDPSLAGQNQRIWDWHDGVTDWQVILSESSKTVFGSPVSDDNVGSGTSNRIPLNVWTHTVFVRDGASYLIYYNGVSQSVSATVPGDPMATAEFFRIGADISVAGDNGHFTGSISDVRIYNRVLSTAEITQLYDSYNPVVKTGSLEKGLVGNWQLNGESEKVGSELVSNGTFEAGTTSWTGTGTCTIAEEVSIVHSGSKSLKCTRSGSGSYAYQQLTLVVGKTYKISGWVYVGGTDAIIRVGTDQSTNAGTEYGGDSITTTEQWIKSEGTFTATVTNPYINLGNGGDGLSNYWDDISIKPLQTADSTPNANHGTVYGSTLTTDRKGQADGAMSFVSAESDYVQIPVTTSLNLPTERTIAMWVKPTTIIDETFISLGTQYLMLINSAGSIYYKYWGATSNAWRAYYTANSVMSAGVSHHIVLVENHNWSVPKIYRDGVELSITSVTREDNAGTTATLMIGRYSIYSYQPFNGTISDTRIYNRALSQAEITQLYDSYKPQLSTGSLNKGLVLDMPLKEVDEKVGSELITAQANRDFSGTPDWEDVNLVSTGGAYDETGDLTITATAQDRYCRLPIAFIGTLTVGKSYRIMVTASNLSGTGFQLQFGGSNQNSGEAITEGVYTWDFTLLTGATNFMINARGAGSITLDNFSFKELRTADKTPNSNHGVVYGASVNTDYTDFVTDDYISIADNTVLNIGGAYTINAWFNASAFANHGHIVRKARGEYFIRTSADEKFHGFAYDGSGYNELTSINTLTTGIWYMGTLVYDGSTTTKLYLNSVFQDEDTSAVPITTAGTLDIGWSSYDSGNYFNGSISNVKIYNRELTLTEVEMLYDQGR